MMLLHEDTGTLLMFCVDGVWDLPYLVYPKSLSDDTTLCCRDLQDLLGIASDDTCFTVVVELLGAFAIGREDYEREAGLGQLMMVESHIDAFDLPENAAWKDATFVSSLLEVQPEKRTLHACLDVVLNCMQPESSILASLRSPRDQYGWFRKAANLLTSAVSSEGAKVSGSVIQEHVSLTSTLLKVDSSDGWFFLKAPALGCNEVTITSTVASLFPQSTPEVVTTCDDLNCIVLKEFTEIQMEDTDIGDMARKLGHMQLQSMQHLSKLRDGGCPVRGPADIAMKIDEWTREKGTGQIFNSLHGMFRNIAPELKRLCSQLDNYRIPLTLVHGDFSLQNATFASANSREIFLFDWQYACIGHPFCDFHRLHSDISEEALREYLGMWSGFESMERAKEAYELAQKLGWCLKMWSISDCYEQGNPQARSSLAEYVHDIIEGPLISESSTSNDEGTCGEREEPENIESNVGSGKEVKV